MLVCVRSLLLASLVAALAAACGEDSPPDRPPIEGRCLNAFDDGNDDPSPSGLFHDPGDFDRAGCSDAIPLDSVDTCGIWHLDLEYEDFGPAPGAIRIDLSDGDDLQGLLFGRETEDVRLTESDLFLRHVEVDDQGNEIATRAFDAWRRARTAPWPAPMSAATRKGSAAPRASSPPSWRRSTRSRPRG